MVTGVRRGAGDAPPRAMRTEWRGVALSVLVHGVLLVALMWGVRWQSVGTEVVTAELWSQVPRPAPEVAPPSAPPPPPPPKAETRTPPTVQAEADIALEKARREKAEQERREQAERERLEQERRAKAERERLEQERRDKAERERLEQERREKAERAEREKREQAQKAARERAQAEAREKAAAEQRQARQREENLERMMGQLGTAGGSSTRSGSAGASGAPSSSYAGRLVAAIKPNIVFADSLPGNPAAEVEVRAGPGGTIIGRTLIRSSGHPEWDEAVLRAIDRTGTLPKDTDGRVPSRLTITFRPRD